MKKSLLIPLSLLLPCGVHADPPHCVESIYQGVTLSGEVVNLCKLDTPQFRYSRLAKDTDIPLLQKEIEPDQAHYIDNEKGNTFLKTFIVREGPFTLKFSYGMNHNGDEFATITQVSDKQVVEETHVSVESLTQNIDSHLQQYGVKQIDLTGPLPSCRRSFFSGKTPEGISLNLCQLADGYVYYEQTQANHPPVTFKVATAQVTYQVDKKASKLRKTLHLTHQGTDYQFVIDVNAIGQQTGRVDVMINQQTQTTYTLDPSTLSSDISAYLEPLGIRPRETAADE